MQRRTAWWGSGICGRGRGGVVIIVVASAGPGEERVLTLEHPVSDVSVLESHEIRSVGGKGAERRRRSSAGVAAAMRVRRWKENNSVVGTCETRLLPT